jgi:hypothetical protein
MSVPNTAGADMILEDRARLLVVATVLMLAPLVWYFS